jgi:NAD-dependent deacetylase
VLTQNIDGLHRAVKTINLIEMHGYAFDLYCLRCGSRYTFDKLFPNGEKPSEFPPSCRQSQCAGMIRPNVVLFGEHPPKDAQMKLQAVLNRGLNLVISIGTTSSFPYIVAPVYTPGIPTVEINPAETAISKVVTYRIPLKASEAMEYIWRSLNV